MKLFYFLSFLALFESGATQIAIVQNYIYSVSEIIAALRESGQDMYQAEYFFRVVENLITGVPFQIASGILNSVCSTVLAQGRDQTPDQYVPRREDIKLQLRTSCGGREYAIDNILEIAEDPDFDPERKTVIFSTGFLSTVNFPATGELAQAFSCRGDTNFLVLDSGGYLTTLYVWAAQNTDTIGEYLAEGIQSLSQIIDIEKLHIIGHSLGAQIMAAAARHYTDLTGNQLPHVTGLDPASPCFNEGEVLTIISASDAEFVDTIITTPGIAGQFAASGDATFYVGGLFPTQVPCTTLRCSHEIAINYYIESVYPNNERNFLARRCSSLYRLNTGRCNGDEYPMGLAVPHDIKGRFILEVNEERPYGQNATEEYMDPQTTTCGICEVTEEEIA
ncbi:vitellogenin-1-like isoform X2 [Bactrocera dorsalis]|uniref:Vitellogenin-1-like isoform X2 n=1 Tax=Bactrocera dorsalis TaxID=27457 RepID=A0ABM3JQ63_BACDO|nr:vitellogenin-1-like isoform X2 [Bactrocera dorsalis]